MGCEGEFIVDEQGAPDLTVGAEHAEAVAHPPADIEEREPRGEGQIGDLPVSDPSVEASGGEGDAARTIPYPEA